MPKWLGRIIARVGLRRVRNSVGIVPGTESFQALWDWINSPLRAGQTLDWELRNKIYRLRQDARNLALNNPLIRQYLQLLEQNVIGPRGMRLQAQVRNNDGNLAKGINDRIEEAFAGFWRSPWVDGRLSGIQGEHLLIRTLAVDGEIFVRRVVGSRFKYGFALQMIDADLVDHTLNRPRGPEGNEIRLGIEVDEYGAMAAIWCWNSQPQDISTSVPRNRVRIPADEVIHIYDPERISQTRGITWLNSVRLSVNVADGYVEASLVAARTAACAFPVFEVDPQAFPVDPQSAPPQYNIELNPGKGLSLPPGLKLGKWDPSQPTQSFGEIIKAAVRWMASGLNVSYNALANDLENVNLSSIRSGLLIERDGWRCHQQMWVDRFRFPVHGWFVKYSLLAGALSLDSRDPRKFLAAKFVPRGWSWIDPLKEVNAAVIGIQEGLGSRSGYLAEQGEDFEEICERQKDDNRISSEAGLVFGDPAVVAAAKGAVGPDEEQPQPVATARPGRLALLNMITEGEHA